MPAPHRARALSNRHMVAAGNYHAALVGMNILEAGGNAVDAGVAAGIVLGVTNCDQVNFGGVAPIMIRMAETGKVMTISGLGWWPKAADINYFIDECGGKMPPGVRRTVMPAAPDAWIKALQLYGTMTFGEVVEGAKRLAGEGYPATTLNAELMEANKDAYAKWPANKAVFLPGGKPSVAGQNFVQSDLAATMQYMVDEEKAAKGGREAGLQAARDAFYKGDIAAKIADYNKENGGWVTREDLAEYESGHEEPYAVDFMDFTVYGCGPWCQGPIILETLNILSGVDLKSMGHNTPEYLHNLTEALNLAYADRHTYQGDPRFIDVPMDQILDKDYGATRRSLIDPEKAFGEMPPAGTPEELGIAARASVPAGDKAEGYKEMAVDTAYACAVDKDGNVFSATPSDGQHSSPMIPGLGFVPSNRGTQSWTDPENPACMAPGKRPRLTPNPAIALKEGKWVMPFGSPGNDVQPQAMLQVLLNHHLWGMRPLEAVEAPRVASTNFPRSSEPHDYFAGRLNAESRIESDVCDALSAKGHDVKMWPDWEWRAGAVSMIKSDLETGIMEGAADPRRPGLALGG
ncbi:MAG: gamma-glutamyltransferase [Rhodospirillaceae bacterium]|nr:gamma-glutamyltransferase [Rhodospirillaceae bacterium]HAA93379.1 gamma-glutamyltransferase [Rhodospirillaceae bacterium]